MKKYRLFTSESVTEGHPDKVCDLIADSILDAALAAGQWRVLSEDEVAQLRAQVL